MTKHDIELPPLPDLPAYSAEVFDREVKVVSETMAEQLMHDYARAAIEADRKRRGEPVAWRLVPKELIDFLDAKEHHLPVEDRHVLSIMLEAAMEQQT